MQHQFPILRNRLSATIALAAGSLTVVLGLVLLVSWHARIDSLLVLRSGFPPTQYNTAILLVLAGASLVLVQLQRRGGALALAAIVIGAGLLSLGQDLLGVDLGIDQLLFTSDIESDVASPGRMAPQTAVALVLSGVAISLSAWQSRFRHRSFLQAVIGSLVVSIGVVALAGFLTGFEQAASWGQLTRMAPQSALAFVILGHGIIAVAWSDVTRASAASPRWLFAPITLAVATVSVFFCQALLNYEDRQIEIAATTEAAVVRQEVESELAANVDVIERIAGRWGNNGRPARERWEADVNLNFSELAVFHTIEWIDRTQHGRWVVPTDAKDSSVGVDLRETPELLETLAIARSRQETAISPPFDRGRGPEIAVAHAIYIDGIFDGFIIGSFMVDELFGTILHSNVAPGSSISVSIQQRHTYTRDAGGDADGQRWAVEMPGTVNNAAVTVRVWPNSVSPQRSLLPYGALIAGFIVAGLLGLVTWLLQEAHQRALVIQQANASLRIEVAERTRAEAELRDSTAALERSNRSLQEFAYVASHDLKAPLVSLQGLATMLKDDAGDRLDGDMRLYLDRIVVNATRMRNLLDDLLELSRVGREDVPVSDVDLNEVVEGVRGQLEQSLHERNAQLVVNATLPVVSGNPVRLHQVFANLIDNALKYTPVERRPRIEINARRAGQLWRVYVRDNGAGIAAEHREKIFTMFQRLPKGRSMNPTGTGMGLAIISRIVEANGGRCWIDASDDEGTTFCLTFPVAASDQPQQPSRGPEATGAAATIETRRHDGLSHDQRLAHLPDR